MGPAGRLVQASSLSTWLATRSSASRASDDGHGPPVHRRTIVLVGLMAVGKSTVGMRLANRLRLPFVDSDKEIERVTRLSIADLFERYGETEFRDGERRVLARLIDGSPKVVATGGGAFMNEETRRLILDHAHVVWLDADIDTLAARASRRPGQRPLLKARDPREALAELAAARNAIYALAHTRICNGPDGHAAAVAAIVKAIEQAPPAPETDSNGTPPDGLVLQKASLATIADNNLGEAARSVP